MRPKDIRQWVSSSNTSVESPYDSDDEMKPDGQSNGVAANGEDTVAALQDWDSFLAGVERKLRSPSTRDRRYLLEQQLSFLIEKDGEAKLDESQTSELLLLLLATYARYSDKESRTAAQKVTSQLILSQERASAKGNSAAQRAIQWLQQEVQLVCRPTKSGYFASSSVHRANLVSWSSLLYHTITRLAKQRGIACSTLEGWNVLVGTFALAYDAIAVDKEHKPALVKNATAAVRRSVRTSHFSIPDLLTTLLATPSTRHVALAGLTLDVCLRLRAGAETSKGTPNGLGRQYITHFKRALLDYYAANVLSSKIALPSHVYDAFHDFVAQTVTEEDFVASLKQPMEKMLLRSPELAIPASRSFFAAYSGDAAGQLTALGPQLLSAAKSSSANTRSLVCELFDVLANRCNKDDKALIAFAEELLSSLKGGKLTSADQRASFYILLAKVPASESVSKKAAIDVSAMLAKEAQEASMKGAMSALEVHLGWCLANDVSCGEQVGKAICKEMNNAKVPLRKAVCVGVGSLMLSVPQDVDAATSSAKSFGDSLLPGFEVNLKNATTNTLTSPSGPLEGYVAVTIIEGRLALWGLERVKTFLKKDAICQTLSAVAPKPSFILNDKVIRRLASAEEELWLLHALMALILNRSKTFQDDEGARSAASQAIASLALSPKDPSTSKETLTTLEKITKAQPRLAAYFVQQGLTTWLYANEVQSAKQATSAPAKPTADVEETAAPKLKDHSRDVKGMLLGCVSFEEGTSVDLRFDILTDLLVIAHHTELGSQHRQFFVELCKRAQVDPSLLVESRLTQLLEVSRKAQRVDSLRRAAFASLSTLVLIAPEQVTSVLIATVHDSIRVDEIQRLTQDEIGIWKTPADALYVDVLAKKETNQRIDRNRKDASLEQWDAELREQLAKKKAAEAKTLTKEQKAAVDAQMKEEKTIRARVTTIETRLIDSLRIITSIVESRALQGLEGRLTGLMTLLLELAAMPQASLLASATLQSALESLSTCCSERLADYSHLVRIALLRSTNPDLVDENFLGEPLNDLTLRVLYRLRLLCDQAPLDLITVAFVEPLISTIIKKGGLGVSSDDTDAATEQVQLALDFITFHGTSCRDERFPRRHFIDDLVTIVSTQTQLAKDAVSALRTLGESMKANATLEEIERLLEHTLADEVYVRAGSLQALQPLDLTDYEFCVPLWLAFHDEDEENARLARKAWEENGLDVPVDYGRVLLTMLEHKHKYVRFSAGRSLAAAAELHPETAADTMLALRLLYEKKNEILEPQYDRFGLVIEETLNREDPWPIRAAVALTFQQMAPYVPSSELVPFYEFLIGKEALGDRSEEVRQKMLDAGTNIIDLHGRLCVSELISMFESYLQHPAAETNDDVTEAVIILFGRLARHLDASDSRVSKVVDRLVDALKTPSELVQVAVTDCLPPLVVAIGKDVPRLIEKLFNDLLYAAKYAERRGAAYGLAGLIKGRGISSIAEFKIMTRLAEAVEDKKNVSGRQGAMMAYETLIATLQRLFEPYIPSILPQLLTCFGDPSKEVQAATQETARVIMQNISGYGVKLIMPSLLAGLDEKQWRTKKGAIELLGAMAYCAPRQLSHFLPTIIPHLSEPIKDSHTQVRQSAERALKGFGDVISNPEVKELVPAIMKALIDPNAKTAYAQRAILAQKWVHVLDGPSLALIIPVIDRGLRERGASVQKDAARIVGNLASLTDSKDFVPYLETLVPLIRLVLVSPVPDARGTAAKALGTLVERLGEIHFVDLVPSLLAILKSDKSGVDRQGSAQGLAEVLAGLGIERMEALLPEIISNASSALKATVRESHILLLIYLPATFGLRFSPHLGRIIPPILGGIADDSDTVREASMRAGRMIIANYSNKAVDLLLPELELGLFDGSWRIRLSSIQLISDLLFRLCGVSGNNEVENEDDEDGGAEQNIVAGHTIQKSLGEALGVERRDNLFAALYILRQDSIINVRQAAITVWKALVNNTPRMAREILRLLIDMVIKLLAQSEETREMAGRALGELTSKLGERILAESIPMLERKSAESDDPVLRAGVCFAVTEILTNSTDNQLHDHRDRLIELVRSGLVDASRDVREAAAEAFHALQQHMGAYAIDQIVPSLLEALVNEDEEVEEEEEDEDGEEEQEEDEGDAVQEAEGVTSEKDEEDDGEEEEEEGDEEEDDSEQGRALSALQEIMRGSADSVFPVLVPTLIQQPMTAFNASALVTLGTLAGNSLYRRLSTIMDALTGSIDLEQDDDIKSSLQESLSTLLSCIWEYEGVYQLMNVLLTWTGNNDSAQLRARGCRIFTTFCEVKDEDADLGTYGIDWVRRLVSLFDDRNEEVVEETVKAFEALIKTVPKEDLESIVVPLRNTLESTGIPGKELAGFQRPRGAAPLSTVFLAGLMNGTADQREQGAYGLADIAGRTSAESIKPLMVSMIGPLIRSCGDRHQPQVKAAILYSLTAMLRFPQHCKPFYPQLQRSFQKAVSDPYSVKVRTQAGLGLGKLMAHQARVDAVVTDLISQIKPGNVPGHSMSTDVIDLANSAARALARVLENAPSQNVGTGSRQALDALLSEVFENGQAQEGFKIAVADVMGSYLLIAESGDIGDLMHKYVCSAEGLACDAAFASLCTNEMLNKDPQLLYHSLEMPRRLARLVGGWVNDGPSIARPARDSRELMKTRVPWSGDDDVRQVLE